MKIYFDGCSWTKGLELNNPEEERYSKLVCDEVGAEETNFAMHGGSNDRIIRNLIVENNIEEYDYAVIQMTFPARTEYLDDKWRYVNPCGHPPLLKEHLAGNISAEDMCVYEKLFGYCKDYDKQLKDPVWKVIGMKIRKYIPFLNIDKEKYKSYLMNRMRERHE